MLNVLVTRSVADNQSIIQQYSQPYLKILACDLLTRRLKLNLKLLLTELNLISTKYLLVTSHYLAQQFPNNNEISAQKIKIFVVGAHSATILTDKGYEIVQQAPSATALREIIIAKYHDKCIYYLAGDPITLEMPGNVHKTICYQTSYRQQLTALQCQYIQNKLDYLLIYSENCAKTLLSLLSQHKLLDNLQHIQVIAISHKVGKVFTNYTDYDIIVRSNTPQMFSYINREYHNGRKKYRAP